MSHVIKVAHAMSAVDFRILGLLKPRDAGEAAAALSAHLTTRMSGTGGVGELEVSKDRVAAIWEPSPAETLSHRARVESVYFSHVLQVGMLSDPRGPIGGTIYQGQGEELSMALLGMHMYRLDPAMVMRDSVVMTEAAPLYPLAWMTCGVIHLDMAKRKEALACFIRMLDVKPHDRMALKYLAICTIIGKPKDAVGWMEASLEEAAEEGFIPGPNERVTYGMALLAAKATKEARVQFDLMDLGMPVMTPKQWAEWGYQLPTELVPAALMDPAKGLHHLQWRERGEDLPPVVS